jgi:hypothetical protein
MNFTVIPKKSLWDFMFSQQWLYCLQHQGNLMMEAVRTSEALVYFSETTWCCIPESYKLNKICCLWMQHHYCSSPNSLELWSFKQSNHGRFMRNRLCSRYKDAMQSLYWHDWNTAQICISNKLWDKQLTQEYSHITLPLLWGRKCYCHLNCWH